LFIFTPWFRVAKLYGVATVGEDKVSHNNLDTNKTAGFFQAPLLL